jgi:hypothetical protein
VQPAARRKIDRISIDSRVRGTSLPKHAQALGSGWWRVRPLQGCAVGVMEWMGLVSCQVCLQQQHSENPQIYPSIATVQSITTTCSRSRKLHLVRTSSSVDGVFEIMEVIGTPLTRGTVEHIARYQRYATTPRSPFRLSIGLGCSALAGRVGAAGVPHWTRLCRRFGRRTLWTDMPGGCVLA